MNKIKVSKRKVISISMILIILSMSHGTSNGLTLKNTESLIPLQENKMTIEFATLFGGSAEDDGYNIVFDENDNIYIAGATRSNNFPIMGGLFTTNPSAIIGARSGFIAKFSPQGEMLASTILGGSSQDTIRGLALDRENNIIVTGDTLSNDFPITLNALESTYGGGQTFYAGFDFCCGDGFITKISSNFSTLLYSSYIGGSKSEGRLGLNLDLNENIIITGITESNDFNTTEDAIYSNLQGSQDVFLTILSPDGSELIYSSYIGGTGTDTATIGNDLITDEDNNIYLTGSTTSQDFPLTPDAYDSTIRGLASGFLMKLDAATYQIEFSTLFGGNSVELPHAIQLDKVGNIFITGNTDSSDFPVSETAPQTEFAGGKCTNVGSPSCGDGFLAKFSPAGQLIYSTYFGGTSIDIPMTMVLDDFDNIIINGWTESIDLPTKNAYQDTFGGAWDGFIVVYSGSTNEMIYSSYLGGSQYSFINRANVNNIGEIFVTGYTQSSTFPATDGSIHNGASDVMLVKFSMDLPRSNPNVSSQTSITTTTSNYGTDEISTPKPTTSTSNDAYFNFNFTILFGFVIILRYSNRTRRFELI